MSLRSILRSWTQYYWKIFIPNCIGVCSKVGVFFVYYMYEKWCDICVCTSFFIIIIIIWCTDLEVCMQHYEYFCVSICVVFCTTLYTSILRSRKMNLYSYFRQWTISTLRHQLSGKPCDKQWSQAELCNMGQELPVPPGYFPLNSAPCSPLLETPWTQSSTPGNAFSVCCLSLLRPINFLRKLKNTWAMLKNYKFVNYAQVLHLLLDYLHCDWKHMKNRI